MSFVRELAPMAFDLAAARPDVQFTWEQKWQSAVGVPSVDFLMDVRNVVVAASTAVAIKPAIQLALGRTDRPDDGALITNGSVITSANLYKFSETLSVSAYNFWRRGVGISLTGASPTFGRAQGVLYTSYRCFGNVLPPEEIVFNPTNNDNTPSYFPLGGGKPVPTTGLSKAKTFVFGMGNRNNNMEWRLAARGFNDLLQRGDWTDLGSWVATSQGDFVGNTQEIDFTGITLANFMWVELALAVRKVNNGDPNSRCVFHVLPSVKY